MARTVTCPLCSSQYQSVKGVREHMLRVHDEHTGLAKAMESMGKDICCRCSKPVYDLAKHEKICPANGAVQQEEAGSGGGRKRHKYEGVSNGEFVELFKSRMSERFKLSSGKGSTVDLYVAVLEKVIRTEEQLDVNFKAFRWFVVDESGCCLPLRNFGEYVEHLVKDQGRSTIERLGTVYQHLHYWISEELAEQVADPLLLHDMKGRKAKDEARLAAKRAGAKEPGQGRKVTVDTDRLDVSIVRSLVEVSLRNPLHEAVLAKLGLGEWIHMGCNARRGDCMDCRCQMEIKCLKDVESFLALSIFIRNFGVRLEVVRHVTLGAVKGARHVIDVCPYCDGKYVYLEHKKLCHR